MKTLLNDISAYSAIAKNSKLFIKHRNLKYYKFKNVSNRRNMRTHQKIKEKDLPYNILLGSSFLIKGCNIIEIYAYCDYMRSLYIPITRYRDGWVCNIDVVNIQEGDPENIKSFIDGYERIITPSVLEYFMVELLNDGFSLYI